MIEQAENLRDLTYDNQTLLLINAYYTLKLSMHVVEVKEENVKTMTLLYNDALKLKDAGMINKAELLTAQVAAENASRELESAKNSVSVVDKAIKNLLKIDDSTARISLINPVTDYANTTNLLPDEEYFNNLVHQNSKALKAIELKKSSLKNQRKIAASGYMPNVAVFAKQNLYSYHLPGYISPKTVLGAGLSWNLFDGLSREANIKLADKAITEAEITKDKTYDQITLGVRSYLTQAEDAMYNLKTLQTTLQLCNELIEIRQKSFKEGMKEYKAEVRFMRALFYYHALDFYRNIPMVTENDPVGSYIPPRYTPQQTFDYIESELKDCVGDMLPASTCPYGQASQGAAYTLLAKLYLNSEVYTGVAKYAECKEACKKVMDMGYSLESDYSKLFNADNNKRTNEIIFALPVSAEHTVSWGSSTYLVCGQLSMSNANQNVADFGVTSGWSEFRLRPEFVDKFTQTDIDGGGDKRCKFFTNGQSKDVTSMTDETTGYLSEKWSNLKDDGTTASNTANDGVETDFPLFRLADVYLMYAECVVRLHNDWDNWGGGSDAADPTVIASRRQGAIYWINQLRERSNASDVWASNFADDDAFLQFILDERTDIDTEEKVIQLLVSAYPDANPAWVGEISSDNLIDNQAPHLPSNPNDKQVESHYNYSSYNKWDDELFRFDPAENATFSSLDSPGQLWGAYYKSIATVNQALAGIDKVCPDGNLSATMKAAKAEALLVRAYCHFQLVNIFAKAYKDDEASKNDVGVPYVTEIEDVVSKKYDRGNVASVYDKIGKDLEAGLEMVSDVNYKTAPKYHFNINAAHAFAARYYLYKRNYEKVIDHANEVLGTDSTSFQRMVMDLSKFEGCSSLSDYANVWHAPEANGNLMLIDTYSLMQRRVFGYRYSYAGPKNKRCSHKAGRLKDFFQEKKNTKKQTPFLMAETATQRQTKTRLSCG